MVLRGGKVSFFPKLIGSSVGIICSFHSVLLNHVPKVRLVNMNALLQNFRIFTIVVFMSAKLVTTTKHRLCKQKFLHLTNVKIYGRSASVFTVNFEWIS